MKLVWDKTGERFFETGVKNAVLYLQASGGTYPKGVAWNGISAITEQPSGAEASPVYADDIKYLNLISAEDYAATIEAYTYPDEFAECDGSASLADGVSIALCYRTTVGNDVDGESYGYKLHIIYGAMAAPSEQAHNTVNDSPEAMQMSWSISTTPVSVPGFKPTASLTIDSTKADKTKLTALEEILYGKDPTTDGGSDGVDPRLPLPDEIKTLMAKG